MSTNLKKLSLQELKQIVEQTINEVKVEKLKENKFLSESVKKKTILEHRAAFIESLLESTQINEEGLFTKAKQAFDKFTKVNPSLDVDNPKRVKTILDKAIRNTNSKALKFKQNALNTVKDINDLHDAAMDTFGKFFHMLDSIPPEERGVYEREVMKSVGLFYNALQNEKGRINSYLSMLRSELAQQGYDLAHAAETFAAHGEPTAKAQSNRHYPLPDESMEATPAYNKVR